MGVSGSGKTTIGKRLSEDLAIPFYDADDYHENKNIRKMKGGGSLSDLDRKPWLDLLSVKIKEWNLDGNSILACSALKKKYRHNLSRNKGVVFIFLDGEYDLIYKRISKRKNHFFLKSMLKKQFFSLDKPGNCINISINKSVDNICSEIIDSLSEKYI